MIKLYKYLTFIIQFKNDMDYNKNLASFREYEKKISKQNLNTIQESERFEEVFKQISKNKLLITKFYRLDAPKKYPTY